MLLSHGPACFVWWLQELTKLCLLHNPTRNIPVELYLVKVVVTDKVHYWQSFGRQKVRLEQRQHLHGYAEEFHPFETSVTGSLTDKLVRAYLTVILNIFRYRIQSA